jgi:hypothetical protein
MKQHANYARRLPEVAVEKYKSAVGLRLARRRVVYLDIFVAVEAPKKSSVAIELCTRECR